MVYIPPGSIDFIGKFVNVGLFFFAPGYCFKVFQIVDEPLKPETVNRLSGYPLCVLLKWG
jgi:hypothetical protein